MLRASSFAFRSFAKRFSSRPLCQALNFQLNANFSTNNERFEANSYSDVNDTSLFEQIIPENLNKDILKSLFSAKDIEQVLNIYGANIDKINEKNIALIIRNISSRTHTLYSETRQTVSRNYHLKDLMMYIKENLENLNEPALTEILTFHRKLKNYHLAHELTYEDEKRLYESLDRMIQEKKVNPKLCAHIFYEYSILRGDVTVPFNFLKEVLTDSNQNTYLTPYACILIIKGIVQMKAEKRKYSDFAYRLCIHLESGVASLNTFQLTTLFNNIASLHLQNATSHKRPPQILWKLKELIEENKQGLSEEDVLNVLAGYTQAPHTLDIKLLQYLKNSVLLTISQKPLNLSLSFLIQFTTIMAEQRDGINLSAESLTMIGNELEKRFEAMHIVKLSHIVSALKAFNDNNFKHENLYACLYKKLIQIPENKYAFNKCISILIFLLKQNFPSEDFARKVILKYSNELSQKHLEWALKVFYICSHPNLPDTPFWSEQREHTFQIIEQQCKKHPNVAIKLLGSRFSNITNAYAIRLQNWALTEIQQKWDDLDFYEKSNYALNFINAKHPENRWSNFIFEKFKDLSKSDLVALLNSYEHKEPKNYFMADLVFKVTNQSPEKFHVLRKIIDAFISTPPIIIMTRKGTPNDEVRKLLDSLLSKPLEIDSEIRPIDLIKLNRNLKLFGVDPKFSHVLTVEYLSKIDFIEQNKTNHFTLAEISELLIEVMENSAFNQEGLVHLKEKATGLFQEIIALLNNHLETENVKNITLNLLVKIVKNFLYLHKVDPSKTDRTFTDFAMNNLFQKLRTINAAQHYSIALNATFLIIEAQILDFYKFDEKRSGQIYDIFKVAVGSATPIALLDYLKNLEKYAGNPNFSSLWNYLNEIQDLYRTSTVQIYPHVIITFLSFFSRIGTRDPHFYNKVLKDIESVFEDLKPKHTADILVSFSFLRIKHEKLFKELSQKILNNINFYQRELPISLIAYARLGFTQDWCQDFIQKALTQIKTSNYNFEGHPLRSVECLWTIALFDINEPQLVQQLTPIFENYVLKDDWLRNDFNKLLINHLYSLYTHGHPSLAGSQLSQEVVSRLEGTKLARTIPINEIPDIYDILEELRISYEKNKYVEDVQIVDLFLPLQRIGILFVSDFYVTFDGTENSGYQIMREKVLESSKCDFKLVHIYEYHWKKLSSKADQIKYLQKLGIDCKNSQ